MNEEKMHRANIKSSESTRSREFSELLRKILRLANRGVSRIELLKEISKELISISNCDEIELRVTDDALHYQWEARIEPKESFSFQKLPYAESDKGLPLPCLSNGSGVEQTCRLLMDGGFDRSSPNFSRKGSFWTGDIVEYVKTLPDKESSTYLETNGHINSLALLPFAIDEKNTGLIMFKSKDKDFFSIEEIEFYESVAQIMGIAIAGRRAHTALRERVKELSCVNGIAQLVEKPGITLENISQGIVDLLPPAMRYPEMASARILLDGKEYCCPSDCIQTRFRLSADIVVDDESRGAVEVFYSEDRPELELGLFLAEEQNLLDVVASYVALIIKRKQWEEEKDRLQEQLRHADRLATLGQLGAGVAHELNEPLGAILGFAQLAAKADNIPDQARKDIAKIENSAIHAREVVKKLLIFARQMPTNKTRVNLNRVVEEGLYFLSSRCAKEGVQLVRQLADDLPEIIADPGQINQVLVNLVVNALQASSEGGTITVITSSSINKVCLTVTDTGQGMSEKILKQIFVPFFTTKEIGQGTGLGLPVVHGIVSSHGGTIEVDSQPGQGSRFTIKLPLTPSGNIQNPEKNLRPEENGQ